MLDRPKMLWFGRPPSEQDVQEAKNRHLIVEVVPQGVAPDFKYARAAMFWATPPYFELAAEALEANVVGALDEGLFLYIVVEGEGQRKDIERTLNAALPEGAPADQYRLRSGPVDPHEGPNAALMHKPGPGAEDRLEIKAPDDVVLRPDQRLLLQRAFHDCKAIDLQPITSGMSGALTFLVDATLSDSNAGSRPVPFFAKLDVPGKLRQEMRRFQEFAEHHVRWYLRPNFVAERRIYGVHQGILVGTFVQPSKSLWEIVLAGDGPRHIRSLFEETLGVLRQESTGPEPSVASTVIEPLEDFCKHERVPAERVNAASSFGGTVHAPRSLWRKLIGLPKQRWRRSAIHGDMHGDNVRIRKEDAIVIDFANATIGPMSADLASLEIWLAFKVPLARKVNREDWRQAAERLYRPETIRLTMTGQTAEMPEAQAGSCVHEIRLLARKSTYSSDEYCRVLALYLLRHSTFPPDKDRREEDEFRRTYAYWLSNRLILALCTAHEPQVEAV